MTAEAIEPEAVVAPTPRPAGKLAGTVLSWVFLLRRVMTYFLFPLLAMARFAFQRVPTVLLGWSTLGDKWTLDALTEPSTIRSSARPCGSASASPSGRSSSRWH